MAEQTSSNYRTSEQYERLVMAIYEEILQSESVDNIEVLHDQSVKGKSGTAHQIDVLWRFRRAGVEHLVLIECKNYGGTVELGDVRSFHSVVEDITGAVGVIVTRVGFQSGAVTFAKHHGIGLKLVKQSQPEDWVGRIGRINLNITFKTFDQRRPLNVQFNVPKEYADEIAGATVKGMSGELRLRDADGNPKLPALGEWLQQVVPLVEQPAGGPYTHRVDLSDTFVVFEDAEKREKLIPVDNITVTYWVSDSTHTSVINAQDVISYVLKDFVSGEVEHLRREK